MKLYLGNLERNLRLAVQLTKSFLAKSIDEIKPPFVHLHGTARCIRRFAMPKAPGLAVSTAQSQIAAGFGQLQA